MPFLIEVRRIPTMTNYLNSVLHDERADPQTLLHVVCRQLVSVHFMLCCSCAENFQGRFCYFGYYQ